MRVKVGDRWYSGTEQLIMVELTEEDKKNIQNMHPGARKYCQHPDNLDWTAEAILRWMDS